MPSPRRLLIGAYLLTLVLIAALHGRSLGYGLFMDDYAHFLQLREANWSLSELTAACRLELVGGAVDLWWLPETTLRFFRPVSFGIMKAVYTASDWSPLVQHLFSLFYHGIVCGLLMLLLRSVGMTPFASAAATLLFALHPANVVPIQWIACQSELLVTIATLGATLAWIRFRGWSSDTPIASTGDATTLSGGIGWYLLALACFTLALGCRENAIMLPFVLAAVELPRLWRARSKRSTWLPYLPLGVLVLTYLLLRGQVLDGLALPPRPYVVPPDAPDFVAFIRDKMIYYLLGEFFLWPIVPISGVPFLRERPLLFYGAFALLLLVLLVVGYRRRDQLAFRFGLIWSVLFVAPVLPAFASPHHLYFPSIGWALVVASLLSVRTRATRSEGTHASESAPRQSDHLSNPADNSNPAHHTNPAPRPITLIGVGTVGVLFGILVHFFGLPLDTAQTVEDVMIDEVLAAPVPVEAGDTLYVANLPMIGHYLQLGIEQRTGKRVRVVAVNWAPRLLGPATPIEIRHVGQRTIELSVAEDRFFDGPLGRMSREAYGESLIERLQSPLESPYGTISLVDHDERGIITLRYTFAPAKDAGRRHLFFASMMRQAEQLDPRWLE